MLEPATNPFLPTEDDSFSVTRCFAPGCQEQVVRGMPACSFHLEPIPPQLSRVMDKLKRLDAGPPVSELAEGTSLQDRKLLDSTAMARKFDGSAKRSLLLTAANSNGTKMNGTSLPSVSRRPFNNGLRTSPKPSLLRQTGHLCSDTPSRKRQRLPPHDVPNPKLHHLAHHLPLGENSPSSGKLEFQAHDSPSANGDSGLILRDQDQKRRASTYQSFLNSSQTPHSFGSILGAGTSSFRSADSSNVKTAGFGGVCCVPSTVLNHAKRPSSGECNAAPAETQDDGSGPSKTKKSEKVTESAYAGLKSVLQTPLLEKQRQCLIETRDLAALDGFIYGQEGSSEPPPGVEKPARRARDLRTMDKVVFGHINPRIHWTRPHSDEWLHKKQEEIRARGGRKANFGKAAQRMKEQRLRQGHSDNWKESLPDRVRNNEAWLGAMRWHHSRMYGGQSLGYLEAHHNRGQETKVVRKKRPYKRRNLGSAPAAEAGSLGPTACLDLDLPNGKIDVSKGS